MLLEEAERRGKSPDPLLVRYDLQRDLGMVCGGAATLFYEVTRRGRWNIAVFGAGHVAQALVPLLCTLDCDVRCIDPRPDWLARLPERGNLHKRHTPAPADAVADLPRDTWYIVMSQGHATDLPIVRSILAHGIPPYVGVIGSVPKSRTLRAALVADGIPHQVVDSVHCPIGLPFGTNAPAEIAISICAQLLQCRDDAATKLAKDVPEAGNN